MIPYHTIFAAGKSSHDACLKGRLDKIWFEDLALRVTLQLQPFNH